MQAGHLRPPSCCGENMKQQTALQLRYSSADRSFIRQWIAYSWDEGVPDPEGVATIPLDFPCLILPIVSWFWPVWGRACSSHQSGKGMQIDVCSRLADGCKLHNSGLYCAWLSHNLVCYNQMDICMEYLWALNGPLAAWGPLRTRLCVKGTVCWAGEAPGVSFIRCVPRVLVQRLEKSLWLFL